MKSRYIILRKHSSGLITEIGIVGSFTTYRTAYYSTAYYSKGLSPEVGAPRWDLPPFENCVVILNTRKL